MADVVVFLLHDLPGESHLSAFMLLVFTLFCENTQKKCPEFAHECIVLLCYIKNNVNVYR